MEGMKIVACCPEIVAEMQEAVTTLSEHEDQEALKNMPIQEKLTMDVLVSHLSSQMEKFDLLLKENEAAQERIRQLQQGSDWLQHTCESLQQSEAAKAQKINMLEKKISELEKTVVDMKLNEAESKSREDFYKLHIGKLEQELGVGVGPQVKLTQSLTTTSSAVDNVRIGKPPQRTPLLTRSFSAFLKKSFVTTDSNGSQEEVTASGDEHEMRIVRPRSNTDEIAAEINKHLEHYTPTRNDTSHRHESRHHRMNSCPVIIPRRETITNESWAEKQLAVDPNVQDDDLHPVFEPAGRDLQQRMSLRGSGTQRGKGDDDDDDGGGDRRSDSIPKKIDLAFC